MRARIFFFCLYVLCLVSLPLVHYSPAAAESDSYLLAGAPAASKPWRGKDYVAAAHLITSGKVPLPEASKPPGSLYFGRLVALDNFAFHKNTGIPIQQRLPDWLDLSESSNNILKAYLNASKNGTQFGTELAQLQAFSLYSSAVALNLVDEFLPTIPKDDPSYGVRMQGVTQMKQGFSTQLFGVLTSTGEPLYSIEDRGRMLSALDANLLVFKRVLPPDQLKELSTKLRLLEETFPRDTERKLIQSMLHKLES